VEYTKTFEMMKAVTGYIINLVIQDLLIICSMEPQRLCQGCTAILLGPSRELKGSCNS
jgi:hypothetical protein